VTRLLIGLGTAHRGDDAVGHQVARRVAELAPPGVDVREVDDPSDLLDVWEGFARVVVVDAMASGRPPGSVVTLDVTDVPLPAGSWAAGGTHALGLAAAVELSRALGRLPARLWVVGVEAGTTASGAAPSGAVTAAVEPAVAAALATLGPGLPGRGGVP
jgi:hydrogenase maturation protease